MCFCVYSTMGGRASKSRRAKSAERSTVDQTSVDKNSDCSQSDVCIELDTSDPACKRSTTVESLLANPLPVGDLHPYQRILCFKQVLVQTPGVPLDSNLVALLWLELNVTPDTPLYFSESSRRLKCLSELHRGAKLSVDEVLVSGVQFLGTLRNVRTAQQEYLAGQARLYSVYDNAFTYSVGQRARADRPAGSRWPSDQSSHCGHGIHFFLHADDAANYFERGATPDWRGDVVTRKLAEPTDAGGREGSLVPVGKLRGGAGRVQRLRAPDELKVPHPGPQAVGENPVGAECSGAHRRPVAGYRGELPQWPLIELREPYEVLTVACAFARFRTTWRRKRAETEGSTALDAENLRLGSQSAAGRAGEGPHQQSRVFCGSAKTAKSDTRGTPAVSFTRVTVVDAIQERIDSEPVSCAICQDSDSEAEGCGEAVHDSPDRSYRHYASFDDECGEQGAPLLERDECEQEHAEDRWGCRKRFLRHLNYDIDD